MEKRGQYMVFFNKYLLVQPDINGFLYVNQQILTLHREIMTQNKYKPSKTFKIAAAAIFAALVAVATLLFVLPIPATSGYFNLGETIIYISTLLLGPFVGAVAGAGASIADILSGYGQFAPGTFAIKSIEGFLVGIIFQKLNNKTKNITLSAVIAVLVGGFEMVVGYFLYEMTALAYPMGLAAAEVPFNIVQMLIGLAIAVPVMHGVLKVFPQLKS
jgi:uncharacterized membrane protein